MSEVSGPVDGRDLALFLDGTWNSTVDNTNVWRMKSLCAGRATGGRPLLLYYDRGVNGLWGGAFGIGLKENVIRAYEWLVDNYQPGDRLFVFGFSRGAFAARSVAGFVAKQGLLSRGAPLGVRQIYERYKRRDCETVYQLRQRVDAGGAADLTLEERWVLRYAQPVPVTMVGVWDTVGALGVPVIQFPVYGSSSFAFLHTGLRQAIQHAYHAIGIDEHRPKFSPTLWTKLSSTMAADRPLAAVEQRWFAGSHTNVGGGYPSDPLAQPPLQWMCAKARALGLAVPGGITSDDVAAAPVRDSYGEFLHGAYKLMSKRSFRPIAQGPVATGKPGETQSSINETIDRSVFEKVRADPSYRPVNLMRWAAEKGVDPGSLTSSVLAADPAASLAD